MINSINELKTYVENEVKGSIRWQHDFIDGDTESATEIWCWVLFESINKEIFVRTITRCDMLGAQSVVQLIASEILKEFVNYTNVVILY